MCLNTLAQSGTRTLGLHKTRLHKNEMIDLSYNTFTTLFNACVLQLSPTAVRCGVIKIFVRLKLCAKQIHAEFPLCEYIHIKLLYDWWHGVGRITCHC